MINDYIEKSEEMVVLFVLIDSRHDITKIDREFLAGLGETGFRSRSYSQKVTNLGRMR